MKTKNKISKMLALLAAISILTVSCKKKEIEKESTSSPSLGTLMFHLHTNVDVNEVSAYDSVYVLASGRKLVVSKSQLYISSIQLVKMDGSTYDISGLNLLKTMECEKYSLGNVPAGNYKSIRFNVGLSSAVNTSMPMSNDSTLNCYSMWMNNGVPASGHAFMNFCGKIDTSAAANNAVAQMQPFNFRIGTSSHLKNVVMPDRNFSVLPGQTQYVHIIIDYGKLFEGVTLNGGNNLNIVTVSDNANSFAGQIANNIPLMFAYD